MLKVISLNLWIGGILLPNILDFLKREQADILLLQEVFNGEDHKLADQYRSLSVLQQHLHYRYQHFAPAFIEKVNNNQILQGQAILSKYPLTELAVVFYGKPLGERINERAHFSETPRNLQHVIAEIRGQQLHILNTQGIWGEHGDDTPERLQMAHIIEQEIRGKHPLVLAGDFNVQPNTKTVGVIEQHLKNLFKNELVTTFNVKQKDLVRDPGYATAVVDMMFVSPDVLVLSHSCPPVDISDHFPLIAELVL